jgi:hypothetical protein
MGYKPDQDSEYQHLALHGFLLLWTAVADGTCSAFRAALVRGSWPNVWPSSTSNVYFELVSRPAPLRKPLGRRPSPGGFAEEHAIQTANKQAIRTTGPPHLFKATTPVQ